MLARNRRRMVEEAAASPVSGGGSYPARPVPALSAIPDGAPPFPCVSASPRAERAAAGSGRTQAHRAQAPPLVSVWTLVGSGGGRRSRQAGRFGLVVLCSAELLVACNGEGETWVLRELSMGRRGHRECRCPTEGDSPGVTRKTPFLPNLPSAVPPGCSGSRPRGSAALSPESWPTRPSQWKVPWPGSGWGSCWCLRPSRAPWAPPAGSLGSFLIIRDV